MTHHPHFAVRLFAAVLAVLLAAGAMIPAAEASAEASGRSAELQLSRADMDFSAKIYMDEKDSVFALLSALSSTEQNSFDSALYFSGNNLIFQCEPLLPDTYGIDAEHLADNLPNSVFAPDSGSKYALDQELYDSILNTIKNRTADTSTSSTAAPILPEKLEKQLGSVVMRYIRKLVLLVGKNSEMHLTPETITIGDKKISTIRTSLSLDAEAFSTIVQELLNTAAKDKDFKSLIGILSDIFKQSGVLPAGGESAVQAIEKFWSSLPELAEKAAKKIEDSQCALTLTMNTAIKGRTMVRLCALLTAQENATEIRLTSAEPYTTSKEITFEVLENGTTSVLLSYNKLDKGLSICLSLKDGTTYTITAQTAEDTDKVFSGTVSLKQVGTSEYSVLCTVLWDKAERRFALEMDLNGSSFSIGGTVTEENDTITITPTEINGDPIDGIRLILRRNETLTIPEFQEITTLREDDITAVISSIYPIFSILRGFI